MKAAQVKPMLEAVKELRDTLANAATSGEGVALSLRNTASTANSTAATVATAASAASAGGGKREKGRSRACDLKRDAARSHAHDAQKSQSEREERDADSRAERHGKKDRRLEEENRREKMEKKKSALTVKTQSAASGSGGGAAGSGTTRLGQNGQNGQSGQNGRGSGGGGQAREQERAKKGPTRKEKAFAFPKEGNPDSMFKLFVGGISKANCSRAMLQAYFSQCVQYREKHTRAPRPPTHSTMCLCTCIV